MRRSETSPLKEALNAYIDSLKIRGKLNEVNLVGQWERIVGPTITKATKEIYVKDRKLFIRLDSSVIRNELTMIKEPLKNRLNEEVGHIVIDEIVFR